MSSIVSLRDVAKSHGARALFTGLSLTVSDGERVGLIGANGSGKSTLLAILAGLSTPDAGERTLRKNARLAYMAQVDVFPEGATAWDAVAEPLKPRLGHGLDETQLYARVGEALSRTGFTDFSLPAAGLSGGWTKRLALARALAQDPDVLFLDEPTNHLDLESVLWLEKVLARAPFAFVMVSHDRVFLENVATRTVELDASYPGGCLAADGPYSSFLEKREEHLAAQAGLEQALASKARREIAWLRRGAKARTTKAKARIDEAGRIMEELDATRQRNLKAAKAGIDFSGTGRQTKRLLVAEGLGRSIGGRTLFKDLDLVLSPGARLGVVGANGSGKSTLLSLLAGETAPDAGQVRRAPGLELAYFDQSREHLDKSITLKAAFAPHGDAVVYRDRSIHVATWAKRFLFRPEQLDLPVGLLSGGEQARVLIARLMLRPADVLLLDEPTNDLDIPTLEVLEESLADFPGAVVLITHDRYLLDSVSTLLLGLDGGGGTMFLADYAQWEAAREEMDRAAAEARDKPAKPARQPKPSARKLTYKEQREWDGMEEAILLAEEALAECKAALEDPAVASDHGELQARLRGMEAAQAQVDRLYARWAELEDKLAGDGF